MGEIMIKKILKVVKKIIMAVLIIYTYNMIALPLNVPIPINVLTILIVTVLGLPSMLVLIIFSLLFF